MPPESRVHPNPVNPDSRSRLSVCGSRTYLPVAEMPSHFQGRIQVSRDALILRLVTVSMGNYSDLQYFQIFVYNGKAKKKKNQKRVWRGAHSHMRIFFWKNFIFLPCHCLKSSSKIHVPTVSNKLYIPKQLKTSFDNFWFVNIEIPHFISSPVKLSFLWRTYISIVKGLDTLHRFNYLEKS